MVSGYTTSKVTAKLWIAGKKKSAPAATPITPMPIYQGPPQAPVAPVVQVVAQPMEQNPIDQNSFEEVPLDLTPVEQVPMDQVVGLEEDPVNDQTPEA